MARSHKALEIAAMGRPHKALEIGGVARSHEISMPAHWIGFVGAGHARDCGMTAA